MTRDEKHSGNQQKLYFKILFFYFQYSTQGYVFLCSLIDHNMIQGRTQTKEDEIGHSSGNEKHNSNL